MEQPACRSRSPQRPGDSVPHGDHCLPAGRLSDSAQPGTGRGIIVRSRSIVGTNGATLQTIVGGNIASLTILCQQTREHAFDLLQHTAEWGANAVIGMR